MCLVIKQNWFQRLFNITPKFEIAEKDINVYKVLSQDAHSLISPCRHYRWYLRKLEQSPIVIRKFKRNPYCYVDVGFHSYTIPTYGMFPLSYGTLYNAIIPKGSRYLVGNNFDIVSDQLIITSKYQQQ